MSPLQVRVASAALLFIVVIVSGLWLSTSGRPLNAILLTVHKLPPAAILVYLVVACYQMNGEVALNKLDLVVVGSTVLFFLGAITSGGFLSTESSMPPAVLIIHRVTSFFAVLSTGIVMFLLRDRM